MHKGFLEPSDLVVVDLQGRKLSGDGEPTGELALHLRALVQRPDATSVVHSHPPIAIAMSLTKKKLDAAKASYEENIAKYRSTVGEWFDKRSEAARKDGNRKLLEQIKV